MGGSIGILIGAFLIVTSSFYPFSFLSPLDAKRISQLLLFVICLSFALFYRPLRQQTAAQLGRIPTTNQVALVLLFVIGIASSLRLHNPGYALADVSILFVMLVMVAVIAASRDISKVFFDKCLVILLSIMGFAVFVQEFMGYIVGWVSGAEFSFNHALVHFGHPRFYNHLQTFSIPIIAALPLFFPTRKSIKSISIALLGLQWFIVISTGARGTTASLLIAMVFIGLWLPLERKYWLRSQIIGVVVGIAIYFGIIMLNSTFIPDTKSGAFLSYSAERTMLHTSGRTKFWIASINDAINNPLLGSGPSSFGCIHPHFPAHPHSFPFRILGEWGVIAAFLLLILAFSTGLKYIRNLKLDTSANSSDTPMKAILAISLIAGIVHSCLSGVMTMPAGQTAMILMGGWALSLTGDDHIQARKPGIFTSIIALGLVLSLALCFFAVKTLSKSLNKADTDIQQGVMKPRFWQEDLACIHHNN